MAEERRVRNGWGGIGVGAGAGAGSVVEDHTASGMGTGDGRDFGRNLGIGGQHESGSSIRWQETELDAEGWGLESGRRGANLSIDIGATSRTEGYAQQTSPVQVTPYTAQYDVRNHLTDIVEGVQSHDVTPAYFGSMNWDVLSPPALPLIGQGQPAPGHSQAINGVAHPLTPITAREYQSCPASIHTSPVPHAAVPQTTNGDGNDSLTSWFGAPRTAPSMIPHLDSWDRYTSSHAPRIAAPAAASPFDQVHAQMSPPSLTWLQAPVSVPPIEDVFNSKWASDEQFTRDLREPQHYQDNMAIYSHSAGAAHPERTSVVEHNAPHPPHSWEGNTIDPRWISPSSSIWSTPAQTPARGRSPAGGMSMVPPQVDPADGVEAEARPREGDTLAQAPPQVVEYTGGTSGSSQGAVMTVQELLRRQSDMGPGSVGQLKPSFAFDCGILGTQSFPPREHERKPTFAGPQGDGDTPRPGQVGNETPPFIPFVPPNMGVGLVGGGAAYTERSWF